MKTRLRRNTRQKESSRDFASGKFRKMCFQCLRPRHFCHCNSLPSIDNLTEIIVVQHIRERSHPFNTARMVGQSLVNSQMIVESSDYVSRHTGLLKPKSALLYPSKTAKDLAMISADDIPEQLVLLDGTWNQVKQLFKNWPALSGLPHYKITPATPGQYRIRLEPDGHSLSTVEATVAALKILEPETCGLDDLLESFAIMVERQLAHPNAQYQRDQSPRNQSANIPLALLAEFGKIVVAYGEAAPVAKKLRPKNAQRLPLYWVAQRLASGEKFSVPIQTGLPISNELLRHFDLTRDYFADATNINGFRKAWKRFSNSDDILVVYNAGTLRLLNAAGIVPPQTFELKSINFDSGSRSRTLADFFADRNFPVEAAGLPGRAGHRLANFVTLVKYLREQVELRGQ